MLAAGLSGLAIILGAFGAHGLKQIVPADAVSTFETGVRYHFYHSLALLITGMLFEKFRNKWVRYAGYGFITGIILFSGSLYLITFLKASESVGLSGIGIVTPIGGVFFILGWIFLMAGFAAKSQSTLKSV